MARPTLSKQEIQTIRVALYALVTKYNTLISDAVVPDEHKLLYQQRAQEARTLAFRLGHKGDDDGERVA